MIETDICYPPSLVEDFEVKGRHFFVKRDDLIDPRYSGNKLRKLYGLLKKSTQNYKRIVSYGGTQSNAMLSIAHLAHVKGWEYHYYCKKLPKWLKANPVGNMKQSLDLGMKVHELNPIGFYKEIEKIKSNLDKDSVWVPQGGADKIAESGIKVLADEVTQWMKRKSLDAITVVTPSGTGTTALYLKKYLLENVTVVTTPVVGDQDTLMAQWQKLEPSMPKPSILHALPKRQFAQPTKIYIDIYNTLKKAGIEFDLIYAPKMWLELLNAYETLTKPILYIHSGGVSGNISQLENYRYKQLI